VDCFIHNYDEIGDSYMVDNCYFEDVMGCCAGGGGFKKSIITNNIAKNVENFVEDRTVFACDEYVHVVADNTVETLAKAFYINSDASNANFNLCRIEIRNNIIRDCFGRPRLTGGVGHHQAVVIDYASPSRQGTTVVYDGNDIEVSSNDNGCEVATLVRIINAEYAEIINNTVKSKSTLSDGILYAYLCDNAHICNNHVNSVAGTPISANAISKNVTIENNHVVFYGGDVSSISVLGMNSANKVVVRNNVVLGDVGYQMRFTGEAFDEAHVFNNYAPNSTSPFRYLTKDAVCNGLYIVGNTVKTEAVSLWNLAPVVKKISNNTLLDSVT
jgi:hypothetical protein